MAGLDPNIIMGIKPVQIDSPLDVQSRALTMRGLAQRVQLQDQEIQANQGVRDAYNGNVVTNPDGTKSVNMKGVVQSLYGTNPMKAQEVQTQASQNELTQKQAQMKSYQDTLEALHSRLGQVKDESSYQDLRKWAIENGIPNADKQPANFDPNWVGNAYKTTASAKDKFEQAGLDLRTKEVGAKIDENKIKREQMGVDKENKMAQDLGKHLAQGWAGRSGQAGQVQGKMNNAEYVEGLINQGKNQPGGLDARQVEEVAQGTARMLGGSAAASARVDALLPHTAVSKGMSYLEWLSNKPQGAELQAFTDRMAETVAREKGIAQDQMRKFQVEGLAEHAALKKKNPALYNSILQEKGITPDMVDKNGRYKAPAAAGTVNMRAPDGTVRAVPADQVEAAKAAGGQAI